MNIKIHCLVVTLERRIVCILSSFDLFQLVEGLRFVAKTRPRLPDARV